MGKIHIAIYKITIDNEFYIGSSFDVRRRITQHKSNLKNKRHENIIMQNYWNKYKSFSYIILESFDNINDQDLRIKEKEWKNKLNPKFNIQDPVTHFNEKVVNKFDLNCNFIKTYNNVAIAAIENNCSQSVIMHCCQENEKLTKSAAGFLWSYNKTCKEYINERYVKIYVYDISGKYISEYNSLQLMCKNMFGGRKWLENTIYRICLNKSASYEGFRFSYNKVSQLDNSKLLTIGKNYPIIQMDKNYNELKVYNTIKSASEELKLNKKSIVTALHSKGSYAGFYWKRLGS